MTNISSIIDGSLAGYLISLALLGITIVQGWAYSHNNYDKWPLRTFVIVLIVLDLTETTCATKVIYYYLVNHFGDIDVLGSPANIISIDFVVTSVIFFISHTFFAHRLWKLTKRWGFSAIITFTSVTTLAIGASSVSPQLSRLVSSEYRKRGTMIQLATFHALAILTDILVAVGLTWSLSKTRTGFKIDQMVLPRLLEFIVTRGILISLVQTAHVILYIHDPKNMLFWSTFHLILTKLYVLTTLVTLNSRTPKPGTVKNVVATETHISFVRPTISMSAYEDREPGSPIYSGNRTSKVPTDSLILRSDSLHLVDVDSKASHQSLDMPPIPAPRVHDREVHHGSQSSSYV